MDGFFSNLKKMQEKLEESQESLKSIIVEGSSGAGLVKLQMNGIFEVLSIYIDKSIIDPNESTVLEDLVKAAINEAHEKIKEETKEGLSKNIDLNNLKDMFDGGN